MSPTTAATRPPRPVRRRRIVPARALPASRRAGGRASADYGAGADPNWRSVDWRAHVGRREVLGRPVGYVDLGRGDGPPVVFIHGLSGRWQCWLENLAAVAEHRRVVALDLPGFGASPLPAERLTITLYARVVDELCEQLGLGPVAVVGNSLGGFTAAEVAIRHPARVERLVLAAAAGVSIAELIPHPARAFLSVLERAIPTDASAQRRLVARPATRHVIFAGMVRHPSRITPDLLLELFGGFGTPGLLPGFAALTSYDYRDRLDSIGCPTLIVHGRNDMQVPTADADRMAALIPGSEVLLFDDTGHLPMLERPRRFNEELLRFLGVPVAAPPPVTAPSS
jgi:pimeloyl-ACP methyl ester carboxylesterase